MPSISRGLAALQARRYTTFSYIVIELHTMVAEVANAYDAIGSWHGVTWCSWSV